MELIVQQLKSALQELMDSDMPSGKKLRSVTTQATRIANLESLVLKNMRSRQRLEIDALLLQSIMNLAHQNYGRVMLADLLQLAEIPALRRTIALGTSRGLITTYNDINGWGQHEEVRIADYTYPAGEMVTGSEEWHYSRRQRRIAEDRGSGRYLRLVRKRSEEIN